MLLLSGSGTGSGSGSGSGGHAHSACTLRLARPRRDTLKSETILSRPPKMPPGPTPPARRCGSHICLHPRFASPQEPPFRLQLNFDAHSPGKKLFNITSFLGLKSCKSSFFICRRLKHSCRDCIIIRRKPKCDALGARRTYSLRLFAPLSTPSGRLVSFARKTVKKHQFRHII